MNMSIGIFRAAFAEVVLAVVIMARLTLASDSTKAPAAASNPVTAAPAAVKFKTVVAKAKIVDFERKKSPLDFHWIGVTDSIMQGASMVKETIVPDGAAGTKQSLNIEGSGIVGKNPNVMFAGVATRFDKTTVYDVTSFTGTKF